MSAYDAVTARDAVKLAIVEIVEPLLETKLMPPTTTGWLNEAPKVVE